MGSAVRLVSAACLAPLVGEADRGRVQRSGCRDRIESLSGGEKPGHESRDLPYLSGQGGLFAGLRARQLG